MTLKNFDCRNKIEELLQIISDDVNNFDRKRHSRTRPESKRQRRKMAHESRRRNR